MALAKNKKEAAHANAHNDGRETVVEKRFSGHPMLYVGTIVVLVIVVIAFVVSPAIVGEAGAGVSTTFGYYGSAPISYVRGNYFYNAFEYYKQYYGNITGAGFERYIWRQAFDTAASRQAVIEEARVSGAAPSDEAVNIAVAKLPDFQENGRFSAVKYRSLDKASRNSIWKEQRESMMAERYTNDSTALLTSAAEADFAANMGGTQRKFLAASFSLNDYPADEVAAYIEAHRDLFTVVHLSQITAGTEKDAQKLLASITAGADFGETAKSSSTDGNADRAGDMGSKTAYELVGEITDVIEREAVLTLKSGEISAVVKTPSGWSFFRAEEDARDADTADSVVIDKARTYILDIERGVIEDYYIARGVALGSQAEIAGFEGALYNAGLGLLSFGPVPINYGDADLFPTVSSFSVSALSGAASNENFWKTAFSAEVGKAARPVVIGNNVVVLYPTEEVTLDDTELATLKTYYTESANSALFSSLSRELLKSRRFKDNFDAVITKLYGE